MTTFNLTCEAVEATLADYLDETLEPWVRISIEEHLGECARCTGLARELRNIAREAASLPALLPEGNVWPRIAGRIGVPVIDSGPVAESAPLTRTTEPTALVSDGPPPFSQPRAASTGAQVVTSEPPPLEREVPLPTSESFVPVTPPPLVVESEPPPLERRVGLSTSESFVQPGALPPVVANELPAVEREVRLPISEPFVQVEPPIVSDEPTSLEREVPLPRSDSPPPVIAPAPPPDTAAPGTATAYPLASRREQTWRLRRIGLAAAALVLATAGTTFLLTVQWLGPSRSPNVASDTRTGKLSSTERVATVPGSRARAGEREQPAPDASSPTPPPGQLRSALTVARFPEDAVYDKEILVLQSIVRRQKRELDTSTVAEIEKNLEALDSAIGQIRAALQQDPGNSMLDGQSSRALEMKVELLRRAAMLRSST